MDITIGSDPEVMLQHKGNLVSALNHVSARKRNPLRLERGSRMLADNVNLEINPLPATDPSEFVDNIAHALEDIKKLLPDMRLLARASAVFPEGEMGDFECKVFGCEPEFNAWNHGSVVRPPLLTDTDFFRSCGGHIHIGFEPAKKNPLRLIQSMDLFVGVPCVIIDHDETSGERHKLYGGAGKFRPTPYGAEYRSPSNYWIRDPRLASLMYSLSMYAVRDIDLPASADAMNAVQNHNTRLAMNVFQSVLMDRLPQYLINDILSFYDERIGEDVFENWGI